MVTRRPVPEALYGTLMFSPASFPRTPSCSAKTIYPFHILPCLFVACSQSATASSQLRRASSPVTRPLSSPRPCRARDLFVSLSTTSWDFTALFQASSMLFLFFHRRLQASLLSCHELAGTVEIFSRIPSCLDDLSFLFCFSWAYRQGRRGPARKQARTNASPPLL